MTGPGASCAAGSVQTCPHSRRKPHRPCYGYGMSSNKLIEPYATDMAKLRKKWGKLTSAERTAELQKIVDKTAKGAGFPPPKVNPDNSLSEGTDGQLDFEHWNIDINDTLLHKPAVTDAEFAELSDTVYHETRHGEQWWLIARRDAAEGVAADKIATSRDISPTVAVAAKKKPLRKTNPKRDCADAMFNSVYGKGSDARDKTLTDMPTDEAKAGAAGTQADNSQKAYEATVANPRSTDQQKQEALKKWKDDYNSYQQAQASSDKTYAAYRALPEEADAWNVGSRANRSVTNKMKNK